MGHQKIKNMISTSDPRVCMIGHPAPPWMVNYADLMTEMVCFFIVLYALSASLNKDVQQAKKDVEEAMKQEKVASEVKVTKDGMQITIQEKGENVFFASGSAELTPRMDEILAKIAPSLLTLAKEGHDIVVEGHTDDIPIRTRFASNWELSTARATNVVQHLIRTEKLPPKHMGAIGYGEYHPLVPNDSAEHRATNRRVVFFVKNKPPDYSEGDKKKAKKKVAEISDTATEVASDEASATESLADKPADEPAAQEEVAAPPVPAE